LPAGVLRHVRFGGYLEATVTMGAVARVIAAFLDDSGPHVGRVYELTGPRRQHMDSLGLDDPSLTLPVP
jgi:uncharacterized protein YbjT (DUF2867 family)